VILGSAEASRQGQHTVGSHAVPARRIITIDGDIRQVLNRAISRIALSANVDAWVASATKVVARARAADPLRHAPAEDGSGLLKYYTAFAALQRAFDTLPNYPLIVSEGANTMDLCREVLRVQQPRSYLDAGTWGTMGVGLGYAIAAAVREPSRPVVAIEGDSAFGFSGMDVETMCR